MSSFTFILHVPDCFYGFCRLRILHISRPQIKATLEQTPHQEIEKMRTRAAAFMHDFTLDLFWHELRLSLGSVVLVSDRLEHSCSLANEANSITVCVFEPYTEINAVCFIFILSFFSFA